MAALVLCLSPGLVVPALYYTPLHFQNAGLKLLAYSHRYIVVADCGLRTRAGRGCGGAHRVCAQGKATGRSPAQSPVFLTDCDLSDHTLVISDQKLMHEYN